MHNHNSQNRSGAKGVNHAASRAREIGNGMAPHSVCGATPERRSAGRRSASQTSLHPKGILRGRIAANKKRPPGGADSVRLLGVVSPSRTVARARLHLAFAVGTLGSNAGLLLGKWPWPARKTGLQQFIQRRSVVYSNLPGTQDGSPGLSRKLSPLISRMWTWWVKRSSIEYGQASSARP